MSYNVIDLNSPYKRRALWKTAMDLQCDILSVQEMHFSNIKTPKCSHVRFPHVFTANDTAKRNGVLIAIKDTITFSLLQEHIDPQGSFIILVAEINHSTYTLVNLYAPNIKPLKFIRKVIKTSKQLQKGNLLLCWGFQYDLE